MSGSKEEREKVKEGEMDMYKGGREIGGERSERPRGGGGDEAERDLRDRGERERHEAEREI